MKINESRKEINVTTSSLQIALHRLHYHYWCREQPIQEGTVYTHPLPVKGLYCKINDELSISRKRKNIEINHRTCVLSYRYLSKNCMWRMASWL